MSYDAHRAWHGSGPQFTTILKVDFNDLDENGRVPSCMSLDVIGAMKPRIGDLVWLEDPEGINCLGRVEHLSGELIESKPFGTTMRPSVRITRQF